jgi:D-sedoheptulose 7-phosphate isomerase
MSRERLQRHLMALDAPLEALGAEVPRIDQWGRLLASVLPGGGRLLVLGNGGSAAHAQHLTAELVGRYCDDRPAFSAIALHADTSALTAIGNDYGADEVFARQVAAHGRPGDVCLALSTSGHSPNVVAGVAEARRRQLTVLAFTGPGPNPVSNCAHDAVMVDSAWTATVQEVHQVALHLLCESFDECIGARTVPT